MPEPSLDEPEKDGVPRCPCCGWECITLYRGRGGEIVGCENCIDALDAVDNRHLAD